MDYVIDYSDFKLIKGSNNDTVKAYRVKYENFWRIGGYVSSKNNLDYNGRCSISENAACIESAIVCENASVEGCSIIIRGSSKVCGYASIGSDDSSWVLVCGDSLICNDVSIGEGIINNSVVSGHNSCVTTYTNNNQDRACDFVGVVDCNLTGSIIFQHIFLIKNIKTSKNLLFGAGAKVLDEDEYFFIETSDIRICVYRSYHGRLNIMHSNMNISVDFDRILENTFLREGIDDMLLSLVQAGVEKTVLRTWSCIRKGIHYKFKIFKKGEFCVLRGQRVTISEDSIAIIIDKTAHHLLSVEGFKAFSGTSALGMPGRIIDDAIGVLFHENIYFIK